ncbi:MAG: DegT/DnrJ/EryC1/StrS family aminotransferase, partial [bacterium]
MVKNIKEQLAYFGGDKSVHFNLDYVWPIIDEEDIIYLNNIIKKNELSFNYTDKEIRKLEDEFINLIDCDYALALNSGTSALHVAFMSIGLKKGDKVAVPSYTFPATVMPLLSLGVNITFIDTEMYSPRLCCTDLKRKLSKDFKCIVVSHLDGIPSNMPRIKRIAEKNNCFLIEDCAQALGSKIDNCNVGNFGDIGIFSLQQKKLIASGEGGVLVTSDRNIYEKAILYSYLQKRSVEEVKDKQLSKYAYTGLGYNFRIHPLSAALANCQLSRFKKILSKRVY